MPTSNPDAVPPTAAGTDLARFAGLAAEVEVAGELDATWKADIRDLLGAVSRLRAHNAQLLEEHAATHAEWWAERATLKAVWSDRAHLEADNAELRAALQAATEREQEANRQRDLHKRNWDELYEVWNREHIELIDARHGAAKREGLIRGLSQFLDRALSALETEGIAEELAFDVRNFRDYPPFAPASPGAVSPAAPSDTRND